MSCARAHTRARNTYIHTYEGVSRSFRTESIIKSTTINTRWEATQRVMAAKLTRLPHKIEIQLHLVAESCTICSSRSGRPVRTLVHTHTHTHPRTHTHTHTHTQYSYIHVYRSPCTRKCFYKSVETFTAFNLHMSSWQLLFFLWVISCVLHAQFYSNSISLLSSC
jgi:hypothetical protein